MMIPPLTSSDARSYADAIVDTVRESLLVLDADLRVRWANRAFYETFRVAAIETERRRLVDLGNGQWNVPRLVELLHEVMARDEPFGDLVVERDFPGVGPRVTMLNARRLDAGTGGGPLILLGIEDVTERRRQEQSLRRLQRIEVVGRLAAGVAHDFNNLLTVITGRVEILLRRLGASSPHSPDLSVIRATVRRAAAMTGQLLAFSRQQILTPRVLDPRQVLRGLEPILRRLLPETIELVVAPQSTANIRVDLNQLEHVVINLVANAKEAMPTGGRLTIRTADEHLDDAFVRDHPGATAGPVVMLAISDTGVGMSRETQSRIFEPFFTTKTPGKGTGLGLATVDGVVKQSGGSVSVESEPGRGTTLTVRFPQVAEAAEAEPAERGPGDLGGAETILLVEGDDVVRQTVRDSLTDYGYTVVEAPTPSEAIEKSAALRDALHLLLTDLVMPEVSGPELASLVRARCPGVRVLYTSGCTDLALLGRLPVDRSTHIVQKPFAPETLARRIRLALDSKRQDARPG